jgi:hypothetical protein
VGYSFIPVQMEYIIQTGLVYAFTVYALPVLISAGGVALVTKCCTGAVSVPTEGGWCTRARLLALAIAVLLNIVMSMVGPFLHHYSLANVQHGNRLRDIDDHNCHEPSFTPEMTRTCEDLYAQNQLSPTTHALIAAVDALRKSVLGIAAGIILVLIGVWWFANRKLKQRAHAQQRQKWEADFVNQS